MTKTKQKDLNKLSVQELRTELDNLEQKKKSVQQKENTPYIIGEKYLIRTVTMIYTGRLYNVFDKELVITNVAWIPETERWQQTVKDGVFKEVELYPQDKKVILGRGAILDMVQVDWELPTKQK